MLDLTCSKNMSRNLLMNAAFAPIQSYLTARFCWTRESGEKMIPHHVDQVQFPF